MRVARAAAARPLSLLFVFALGLCLVLAAAPAPAHAGLALCGLPPEPDAPVQRLHLRVSAALRAVLQRQPDGAAAALVARDGTDLSRWGIRLSHAGLLLRDHPGGAWTVRQLYYDCEGGAPRVFDQGLAGFIHGSRQQTSGRLSVTLPPAAPAQALAAAALDDRAALGLLNDRYSANAHAYATRYQNCNQWLAELMAHAWGGARNRDDAQAWLRSEGYAAQVVDVGWSGWLWLARLSPWLHLDDHPPEDLAAGRLRISLPEGLSEWVARRHPQAEQWQLCWTAQHIVVRRGAEPLPRDCVASAGDERIPIEP